MTSTKTSAKATSIKIPKTPCQEWTMLCNIGWTEEDAPKLREALSTLKDKKNIEELKKFLQRYPVSAKKTAKKSVKKVVQQVVSTQTIVSQRGLIQIVDNGAMVDYQISKFNYLCDSNAVIVTKKSGRGVVNIAHYVYKSDEEAQDAGWKMAKSQESVEKDVLVKQKAAVKTTLAASKKQRQTQKISASV